MRARPVLGVLAIVGLVIGLLVAVVISAGQGGNQTTAIGWMIQVIVLIGALFVLVSRMRRRS